MVTKSDLATVGLGDTAVGIALLRETPIENICRTINGRMIYDDPKLHFNGKVSIIAMTETRLANYDVQDRLVVLGNDAKAQKTAITKGAGILIVVWVILLMMKFWNWRNYIIVLLSSVVMVQ